MGNPSKSTVIFLQPSPTPLTSLTLRFCLFNAVLLLLTMGAAIAQSATQLSLKSGIDKERILPGGELIISIILTNSGRTAATNLVVQDSLSPALAFQSGSVTAPAGTTFSAPTLPKQTGSWTVDRLDAGQTKTLTFRAVVTDIGVVYHTARIQGITARTCATVPALVCSGDEYAFELTAPANEGNYGWERTIGGSTSRLPSQQDKTLTVNTPGAYRSVLVNGQPCTSGACCPFVIEPVADVPTYSLTGTPPACSGTVVSDNGNLRLLGPGSTIGLTYQLAAGGTDFGTARLLTLNPQAIPATGLLSIRLTAGTYRVRVFNAAGCFRDSVATIAPANCNCPPPRCVPFILQQTKKAPRVVVR